MSKEQIHQLQQRELYVSRNLEILPATHIRGKCHVSMRDEMTEENWQSLLNKEDAFYFRLVYDPSKKILRADKCSIRVGSDFQATVPDKICEYKTGFILICIRQFPVMLWTLSNLLPHQSWLLDNLDFNRNSNNNID